MAELESLSTQSQSQQPKKRLWPNNFSKKQRTLVAALGIGLIGAAILIGYIQRQPPEKVAEILPQANPSPTPEPKTIPNPLNGELYTQTEALSYATYRPIAVMVENHVEARPQSGINQAEVLYEAMAEGGITRFMAVYLHNLPEKIGPVRSARLHFVDWAAEYDATYAHWGGSAESLAFLRSNNRPKDLDQFFNAGAFFRDNSGGKSLEHTGYTSMGQLRQTAKAKGWEEAATFTSWQFKDDAKETDRPQSQSIQLGFLGTSGYAARFEYRSPNNDYIRFTGGQPHLDTSNQQLTAKTIVLMIQSVTPYVDEGGHAAVRVQTTGSGRAIIIEDGVATEGVWTKDNRNARTQLTAADGRNIELNRGKIWVVSVPAGSPMSY